MGVHKYFTEDNEEIENLDEELYDKAEEELFKNSSTRCPVVLVLDTSGSMRGSKIEELNRIVREFYDYVRDDQICRYRVEFAIVNFDDEPVLVSDFSSIDVKSAFEDLTAQRNTRMIPALKLVLEMVKNRKKEYKDSGRSYFRPLIFFLTDGGPTDNIQDFKELRSEINRMSQRKELAFFAIKIGTESSPDAEARHSELLRGFDSTIPAARLNEAKFDQFFQWLSASVKSTSSQSDPSKLAVEDPSSWWENL